MKTDQKDKQQIIIDGLLTTLGYREQRIDELEAELITWKTRAEVAERKVKYLLKKLDELKAEYEELQTNAEILASGVRDLNHENYELTEKIKQVQIDVLNKLKDIVFDYLGVKNIKEAEALSLLDSTLTYDIVTCGIDEIIKEIENDKKDV